MQLKHPETLEEALAGYESITGESEYGKVFSFSDGHSMHSRKGLITRFEEDGTLSAQYGYDNGILVPKFEEPGYFKN